MWTEADDDYLPPPSTPEGWREADADWERWTEEPMSEPLFDFSRFPTRTWPYGTRKAVTVLGADPETRLLGCVDAANEAYFLLGGWNPPVQRGDRGEIIFTEGGPTGGYWRYEAAPEGEPHE